MAFQGSGAVNPTAVTGPDGSYALSDVPRGHYVKLLASGHGYQQKAVVVGPGTPTVDFSVSAGPRAAR